MALYNAIDEADAASNENETAETITNFIQLLGKELNIEGSKGVFGKELELIALIRNCEFLYNKRLQDPIKKDAAWKAIAAVMNTTAFEVQHRWRTLRETYNRYTKDLESGKHIDKPWEYYEDMKFIEPHISRRKSFISKSEKLSLASEEIKHLNADYGPEGVGDIMIMIHMIKERPILYDNKHPEFKNKELRQLAWSEVSQKTGIAVSECQGRWKTLRERFGRERKHHDNSKKQWELYEALQFLDRHVRPRHSLFRYKKCHENGSDININATDLTEDYTESTIILQAGNPLDSMSASVEHMDDIQNLEFVNVSNSSSVSGMSKTTDENRSSVRDKRYCLRVTGGSPQYINDEDELFGLSIAAELRKIPSSKKKMKIKADMYKLLYENESDEEVN